MKLNYSFIFIIPIALIFFMDNMFMELTAPNDPYTQGMVLSLVVKGMAAISFIYSALCFNRMSPTMRFGFVLLTLYVFGMVFESYYFYNSFMVYPHVFQKLFLFYYAFFVYTFYKGSYYLKFSHVVYFILIGFWLNVLIVNPHTLSISSFTSHDRGVHSSSVYMLVVPFLYYLSNYLYKGNLTSLLASFLVLLSIVFFQHRTVWISTAVVLAVYYIFVKFKSQVQVNFLSRLVPIGTVLLIAGIASSAFLFSIHPEIITKIQESFSDIENFESQGTGGWRYQQWMSYLPFIQEHWFLGMRFDGFELPIQFYRDDLNAPVFEDGNGHFFHSFYVDVMFYTGAVGLGIFCILPIHALVRGIRQRKLTINQIILVSFIMSGFVFGISYVLPVFFYGILGWAVVTMEEDYEDRTTYLRDFAYRWKQKTAGARAKLISH